MPDDPRDAKRENTRPLGEFLGNLPVFAGLGPARLETLAAQCVVREAPRGSYLFLQGDQADALYVVRSGSIAILLSSPDGRELVINEMRPGDFFGELGLLTGQPRSTHALSRAPEGSVVVMISRQTFLTLLEEEPSLSRRLLETTAQRLQNSSDREGALAFLDAEARLARLLLWLDDQASERGYITISQEELAQRASLTRQTVAKALGRWRRRGWLITGRGHIMLLNRARLEEAKEGLNG